jgi:hypothetical protein
VAEKRVRQKNAEKDGYSNFYLKYFGHKWLAENEEVESLRQPHLLPFTDSVTTYGVYEKPLEEE